MPKFKNINFNVYTGVLLLNRTQYEQKLLSLFNVKKLKIIE